MPHVTERVKRCAIKLQYQKLIAKLISGDLVAQDARYHAHCLALYNSHSRCAAEKQANISDGVSYGTALAELVGFIEKTRNRNKNVMCSDCLIWCDCTETGSKTLELNSLVVSTQLT